MCDKRADDDHAKEAVDDGGYARQQVNGGADELAHALAGNLDQVNGRTHAQRHAHGERTDGHQTRAGKQRQDAVVALGRRPLKAKEVRQTDVGKDGQRRVRGKDKNQDDGNDRQERAGKEDPLQRLLLDIGTVRYERQLALLGRLNILLSLGVFLCFHATHSPSRRW